MKLAEALSIRTNLSEKRVAQLKERIKESAKAAGLPDDWRSCTRSWMTYSSSWKTWFIAWTPKHRSLTELNTKETSCRCVSRH